MSLTDLYHTIRGQVLRAVVKLLDDSGPEQHVSVVAHAGQQRTSVPVHYPFGFSSHVPVDGAVTHVLQNGGDPSDLFALPPSNPGAARMGGLNEGETILYDQAGQQLHFQNGRLARIDATAGINLTLRGQPLLTMGAEGSVFHGDLYVKGNLWAGADVMAGSVSLQSHAHSGVQAGGAETGKPGGSGSPPTPPEPVGPIPPRPPWRKADGSFVGTKGNRSNIYIMSESPDPAHEAEIFLQEVKAYMNDIGVSVTDDRQSPRKYVKFSDGTVVTLRGEEQSSEKTPPGWFSLDIGRNADIQKDLPTGNLKLKFPIEE